MAKIRFDVTDRKSLEVGDSLSLEALIRAIFHNVDFSQINYFTLSYEGAIRTPVVALVAQREVDLTALSTKTEAELIELKTAGLKNLSIDAIVAPEEEITKP